MAAPVLQAEGTVLGVTSGTLTPTVPTHQANDILIARAHIWAPASAGAVAAIPTPTSSGGGTWTLIGSQIQTPTTDGYIAWWWMRATGASETCSWSYDASWDTSGTDHAFGGCVDVVRGCITSGDPWDAVAQQGPHAQASPTPGVTVPAVTVSGTERLVLMMANQQDNSGMGVMTGWTASGSRTDAAGTDSGFKNWRKDNVSASTTADTPTMSGTSNGFYAFTGISFKPPAAGTPYDEQVDDSVSVTDSVSKAPSKNLAETPTVTDAVTKDLDKAQADTASVTDSISKATGKAVADSVAVTDEQTKALNKGLSEDLGVTDEIAVEWQAEREVDDTAEVTDAVTKDVDKPISDSASVTDAISLDPGKTVDDAVAVTDEISVDPGKVVADGVSVTDEIEVQWDAFRTFDEGLGVTDEITIDHVSAGGGEMEFNEQAFVTDSIEILWSAVRDFNENLGVTDAVSKHIHLLIEDELVVGDAIQKAARVTIAETMGVADSQVKVVGKGLTENLGVADLLTRQANYLREFGETLTVEDFIAAGLVFPANYEGHGTTSYTDPGASGYPAGADSEYVEAADVSDREADYG